VILLEHGCNYLHRDGMITDEDIDHLLMRSEERTQAESEKLKTEMQHNLANFTLAIGAHETDDAAAGGGTVASKRKSTDISGIGVTATQGFISLPQRERKKTFEVNSYFKEVLSVSLRYALITE
jgi:hypothetical protein